MSLPWLRALAFTLPALATVAAVLSVPGRSRVLGALLLAFTWNLTTLPLVNAVALELGWWAFLAEGPLLLGMPVDLLFGWALLWGPACAAVHRRGAPLIVLVGFALFLDWWWMPALEPLLQLGDRWLLGEALLLAGCLLPGLLFARWTETDRHLPLRVALHLVQFAGLIGLLLPHTVLLHTDGSWAPLLALDRPGASVAVQLFALLALPGLSAVLEFAQRGGGTPVPFDGPVRHVTSGPYAYLRNPMQASTAALFLALGAALGSPWVAGIGAMAVVFGAGFAHWHEQGELSRRWSGWTDWCAAVRPWWPRWRPHVPEPSVLWVARSCGPCQQVAAWLTARGPTGMAIRPAEEHPEALRRMRYEAADGHVDDGLGALARALEHLHLGWALLGFALRLPGIRQTLTVLIDASGGGPRDLPDRPTRP